MTPEEIEIVAKAIKDILSQEADTIFDKDRIAEPDRSVGLNDGNDERVSTKAAQAAITALDRYRKGKSEEPKP
ncbi:hypothetical protein KBI52_10840 [Microvirga sp. HBU67558]|uniref:hypothetical protein n=1 Tax=Microvirga sp. HBU67558 TaxID=2824562 RepID=UPI001B376E28|nr:hypothetical protein [Microvirga sp. HBU67558]MBQ0820701.1 hypothetical protein [Microvirga sp. HBU67558]